MSARSCHAVQRLLLPMVLVCTAVGLPAQEGTQNGEWPTYGGDLASTRYSPLDQINAENFNDLEVAWRLKTDNFGPGPEYNLESTPLMVGGVVYTTAGTRRAVVAADAATGELLWMHRLDEGERGEAAPRLGDPARRLGRSARADRRADDLPRRAVWKPVAHALPLRGA